MRKIHVLGLALVAVFALSSVIATAAFADEWLDVGSGKSEKMAVLNSIIAAHPLFLEDMGSILVKAQEVECKEGTSEGSVGAGAADELTKAEGLHCLVVNAGGGCNQNAGEEVESVVAANLPWTTEIFLEGEMFRDHLLNANNNPGWTVRCKGISDTCTGLVSVLLENNVTEGDVVAEFDAVSEKESEAGKCTSGGVSLILAGGQILIFSDELSIAVS